MSKKKSLVYRASTKLSSDPKHCSRDENEHSHKKIDPTRTKYNWYWTCLDGECKDVSFEKMEIEYFKSRFGPSLEKQNEKHKKSGHHKRVKEMDKFIEDNKPEELLMQIGDKDNTVSKEMLLAVYQDYYDWHTKEFPEVKFLDVALHMDETTPHLHIRRVWELENEKDGTVKINREAILKKHGFELPDPTQKSDKYNNRNMTYTKFVREKLIDICISHGIDMETEVKSSGLEYKSPRDFAIIEEAKEKATAELEAIQANVQKVTTEYDRMQIRLDNLNFTEKKIKDKIQADKNQLDKILEIVNSYNDYYAKQEDDQNSYSTDLFVNALLRQNEDLRELFLKRKTEKIKFDKEMSAKIESITREIKQSEFDDFIDSCL